jgi:hypothetical protein
MQNRFGGFVFYVAGVQGLGHESASLRSKQILDPVFESLRKQSSLLAVPQANTKCKNASRAMRMC